ncbi:hypothetical protein IQ06DRAFT_378395 [Phaeosphaeriaceae sp. SRC1lsM3a]|nr:hypothetical protein IQ06DRAFT_378395 [Stagonospora sp. SRC1lsM3a]
MSTHFRPRPPPVPTSPVRPSTAHSTIRAVTPSPPHELPRPKSAHVIASPDLMTFAQYVLRTEDGDGFSNTPPMSGMLRRSGVRTSRSVSPVKWMSKSVVKEGNARSRIPIKTRPTSVAVGVMAGNEPKMQDDGEGGEGAEEHRNADGDAHNSSGDDDDDDDDDEEVTTSCPDTPTPMTLEQKRHAYHPLVNSPPHNPAHPLSLPPPVFIPTNASTNASTNSSTPPTSPNRPAPPLPRRSSLRLSVSATSHITAASKTSVHTAASKTSIHTVASKHSIFSTPGRDELERKKALVEADEGPFGQATSVADLAEERRRVSGGSRSSKRKEAKKKDGGEGGGGKDRRGKGVDGEGERKKRGCVDCGGVGCVVM